MSKKLIMACLTLGALAAFALPAVASASPRLCETEGATCTNIAVNSKLLATQVGTTTRLKDTSNNVVLTCTTAEMTGELTENTGSHVAGKITFATFGGTGATATGEPHSECTTPIGTGVSVTPIVSALAPWCLTTINVAEGKDEFTANKCGGGNIKFVLAITGLANPCEYESTEHVVGTYQTHAAGDAIMSVTPTPHNGGAGEGTTNGFKKVAGPLACPTTGVLEMSFTLETDTTASADPLYIA
jgi:uncharacterized protein YcfJ